jgi:hypothetical protein
MGRERRAELTITFERNSGTDKTILDRFAAAGFEIVERSIASGRLLHDPLRCPLAGRTAEQPTLLVRELGALPEIVDLEWRPLAHQ